MQADGWAPRSASSQFVSLPQSTSSQLLFRATTCQAPAALNSTVSAADAAVPTSGRANPAPAASVAVSTMAGATAHRHRFPLTPDTPNRTPPTGRSALPRFDAVSDFSSSWGLGRVL